MGKSTCTETGCIEPFLARGLCRRHYQRAHAHGLITTEQGACTEAGCDRPAKARQLCAQHYMRRHRSGDGRPRCTRESCDGALLARGLCSRHYQQERSPKPPPWRFEAASHPIPIRYGAGVLPARFWESVAVTATGCWRWTGWLRKDGYGYFRYIGTDGVRYRRGTHVIAYEAFVGAIPADLVSDHLCHTEDLDCFEAKACPHRACCNPEHIEPVTRGENGRRGHHRHTTICPAGHPYEGVHLAFNSRGYKECATCRRERYPLSRGA